MKTNALFFELIQVAIGNRTSLSSTPTAEEWEEIYEECKKQSLTGIAFAGVERLPREQMPPGRRIRQWAVKVDKIKERNKEVSEECRQISAFFEKNGFDAVILKGLGNYAYYPEHLQGLRAAGDIDVWVRPKGNETQSEIATKRGYATTKTKRPSDYEDENRELLNSGTLEPLNFMNHPVRSVIEFCLSVKKGEYVYYHNMDFPVLKDTPVEVHYRPTWLYNPFRNRALQRWFGQFTVNSLQFTVYDGYNSLQFTVYDGYCIPSAEFNVVFQLLHLYKHIFEEGIGLRQLLDYYFVVTSYETSPKRLRNASDARYENESSNPLNYETIELIRKLGLESFAGAVMYVMQQVFAMPTGKMLYKPDEKRGERLLEEIMKGGNFGKYDERYNWAETTNGSMDYRGASYAVTRLRHNAKFLCDYPSEVLWEPLFRVYHWIWRKFRLWRWE